MSTNRIYNYFCGPRNARTLMASKSPFFHLVLSRFSSHACQFLPRCRCEAADVAACHGSLISRRHLAVGGLTSLPEIVRRTRTALPEVRRCRARDVCRSGGGASKISGGGVGKHVLGWAKSVRGWTPFAAGVQEYNPRKILAKILHFEEFNVLLSVEQKYQCVRYDFSLLQSHTTINVTTCHAALTPTCNIPLYFTTKTW